MFGYYLIQIGDPEPKLELLSASPAKSKIRLDRLGDRVGLRAEPESLPLAADSVDGMLLHHALDFSTDPHQLLREVERVLIPEGKLIVVGFNPWSLWGLRRLLSLRRRQAPWSGNFFSPRRVSDWLSLLGFDLEPVRYLGYRPPTQSQMLNQQLMILERLGQRFWPMAGGVYLVVAVKRSVTMTPLRSRWKLRSKMLPPAVEPTARNMNRVLK
jgi:SAM-dependent methyltransferase